MNKLDEAIILATQAHAGQLDKGGAPYILHPLRVMMAMTTEQERIVAVLHDVIEDSDYTLADIASQFGDDAADDVEALTRRSDETYEAFIRRCSCNPRVCRVKLADVIDNMDLSRLGREPTSHDIERRARYERAYAELRSASRAHGGGEG
ncbi:HD domain-containing protein [uncultured Sphingomonas sp.]|uniref:HD domain-containing protein n=1 Tax=uncultured Sphingomonas sp. TaxID=158754 RepID=UPI00374879B8